MTKLKVTERLCEIWRCCTSLTKIVNSAIKSNPVLPTYTPVRNKSMLSTISYQFVAHTTAGVPLRERRRQKCWDLILCEWSQKKLSFTELVKPGVHLISAPPAFLPESFHIFPFSTDATHFHNIDPKNLVSRKLSTQRRLIFSSLEMLILH